MGNSTGHHLQYITPVSIIIRKPFTVSVRRSAHTFVARWGQVERSMTALWAEECGLGAEKPIVVVACGTWSMGLRLRPCGHTSVALVFALSRMLSVQPYLYIRINKAPYSTFPAHLLVHPADCSPRVWSLNAQPVTTARVLSLARDSEPHCAVTLRV